MAHEATLEARGMRKGGMRTVVQLHRHLSILIVVVELLLHRHWGLRNSFLAGVLGAIGGVLVRLADDLLEGLELVGVVDEPDVHARLLAMVEVVRAIGNVLLGAIARVAQAALAP